MPLVKVAEAIGGDYTEVVEVNTTQEARRCQLSNTVG